MISFSVDRVLPQSSTSRTAPNILAVSHPQIVVTAGLLLNSPAIHIDCIEEDLPGDGLMIAASWQRLDPQAVPHPFVIRVPGRDGRQVECLDPNQHWKFVEGGNGELESAEDSLYVLRPAEVGYFDCFIRPDFSLTTHAYLLLHHIEIGEDSVALLSLMGTSGGFTAGARLIKALATDLIATRSERDEAQQLADDRDRHLREIRARVDMLLRKGPNNPLYGVVGEQRTQGTCGNQVATMITAIGNTTGLPRADLPSAKWIVVDKNWAFLVDPDLLEYWLGPSSDAPAT